MSDEHEHELDRNLDSLIDSALANYAEPDAGLEGRVLARIAEARADEKAPARWRWLPWKLVLPVALPLAACALLIAGLVLYLTPKIEQVRQAKNHTMSQTQTAPAAPENATAQLPKIPASQTESPPVEVRAPRPAMRQTIQQAMTKAAPLPKLDVFPTPQPLAPEEQALVRYVTSTPASERRAILAEQKQRDAPISIAAIEIKPLEPFDKTKN